MIWRSAWGRRVERWETGALPPHTRKPTFSRHHTRSQHESGRLKLPGAGELKYRLRQTAAISVGVFIGFHAPVRERAKRICRGIDVSIISRSDTPSSRSFQAQSLNCRKKPVLGILFICLYFYEIGLSPPMSYLSKVPIRQGRNHVKTNLGN